MLIQSSFRARTSSSPNVRSRSESLRSYYTTQFIFFLSTISWDDLYLKDEEEEDINLLCLRREAIQHTEQCLSFIDLTINQVSERSRKKKHTERHLELCYSMN